MRLTDWTTRKLRTRTSMLVSTYRVVMEATRYWFTCLKLSHASPFVVVALDASRPTTRSVMAGVISRPSGHRMWLVSQAYLHVMLTLAVGSAT